MAGGVGQCSENSQLYTRGPHDSHVERRVDLLELAAVGLRGLRFAAGRSGVEAPQAPQPPALLARHWDQAVGPKAQDLLLRQLETRLLLLTDRSNSHPGAI